MVRRQGDVFGFFWETSLRRVHSVKNKEGLDQLETEETVWNKKNGREVSAVVFFLLRVKRMDLRMVSALYRRCRIPKDRKGQTSCL